MDRAMRNGPEGRESGQPWVNRLAASDNAPFMRHLGATLKGQIDLVYVDPPFATGSRVRGPVGGWDGGLPGHAHGAVPIDARTAQ
jgi:hypothetical protein